jgi:peptide/nickel transport system permease protein
MKGILAKLPRALLTAFLTVTITFFILNVLPSDPARLLAGPQARPADVEALRTELGLNAKVPERYRLFWRRLVHTEARAGAHATCTQLGPIHLDMGRSYRDRRPVLVLLSERFPRTLLLAVVGVCFQLLFGVLLGLLAASRANRWLDAVLMNTSLLGLSIPTFVIGGVFRYVLAERLRLLPLDGYGKTASEHLVSVILPGLTLGFYGAAYYAKLTRAELGAELGRDYIRTARAKGASPARVLWIHALRNSLLPLVTSAAMEFGALLGGAVVTESIFRWPGIGLLSVQSLLDRDGPVVLGLVILASLSVITLNLVADALVRWLDPRTRAAS